MKTIGIKLADGTFYPVLEEGTPKKRMLDLTTAKDNQTKVQIDLYRSENGTMEDAEYVDTLEVTKLNPHPNGEPELHLSVGLDEDNNLTAEVVDPETGKKSETEVALVSRTAAEREEPADFAITNSAEETPVAEENPASTEVEDSTFSPDDLPDIKSDALEDMHFSFDKSESEAAPEESPKNPESFEGALPDYSELDNDLPIEDTTLESVDFSNTDFDGTVSDDVGTESPDLSKTADATETVENFSTEDFSLPDFDSDDTTLTDDSGSDDTTLAGDSLDSDIFNDSDTTQEPEGFDLPDFDAPVTNTDSFSSDSSDLSDASATGLNFDDLDDPAFNSSTDDLFADTDVGSGSGAMDFSDLYDKETIAGEHASLYDEEDENKKTRIPVIICIICAIICVIATILVLFIVPSKYNLLASRNTNGVSILDRFFSKEKETVIEQPYTPPEKDMTVINVKPEEPKDEPAPEAVEDKIIIAPEPEKVVPKPAPVEEKKVEVKKTSDAQYHIKWGDTLWDISESYYKTPWKYPKIADYNNIKNPDLIISGSDILIPAE